MDGWSELSKGDTYLPFSLKDCYFLLGHGLVFLDQRGSNLGLEIVHEVLTPQPQRLGVVASNIQDPFDYQSPFGLSTDMADQL